MLFGENGELLNLDAKGEESKGDESRNDFYGLLAGSVLDLKRVTYLCSLVEAWRVAPALHGIDLR